MSFAVQGWCPGALRPMMSGDGLVVRVRPRMARLDSNQVQGLAKASKTHGNGLIDLSARANIQLRGIRPEAHLTLLDDLNALGLMDQDEATERHRNLVISPFWQPDDGTAEVVAQATAILTSPSMSDLPAKFGVSVDPAAPVLQDVAADIRLERQGANWLVRPEGFQTGALVPEVGPALQDLLTWFLHHGVVQGRGRMAALAGRDLPPGFDHPMTHHAFKPHPGAHDLGQLIGFQFGQMRAETLMALGGPLRITPWRMVLLEGRTAPNLPDLITADDPTLRVSACTGAPGCPQALQPTRDLARKLAPQVPPGQHLHVSGCAKGCAHPRPADITLCATKSGFDLIRNGRAGDQGSPFTETTLFKAL